MSGPAVDLEAFATALQDPDGRPPPGLKTWNGSDPAVRFAVYRNNVVVSLVAALADSFPITRELVGAAFFEAMARRFIAIEPPRSPVLTEYGDGFPDFIAAFEPATSVPYLPDLSRLELARIRAYHAAEAEALGAADLGEYLAAPQRLPETRLTLHPSVSVLESRHAICSLWAAHQGTVPIEGIDPSRQETALVLREGDDVLVLPIQAGIGRFLLALTSGATLGEATTVARTREARFDLTTALVLLIRHGGIAGWHPPGDLEP
jgi:hypothetical protein